MLNYKRVFKASQTMHYVIFFYVSVYCTQSVVQITRTAGTLVGEISTNYLLCSVTDNVGKINI